ncbi:MAG: DEAD/DEAH box helicase family protein, partial [bacterium]
MAFDGTGYASFYGSMKYQLRPYQQEAVERLRDSYRNRNQRVVLVSPTGSGKTVIASNIIERATMKNGGRVLFIAHRREIIDQTSKKLAEIGIPHGVMMGDDGRRDPNAPVQVASIQTLIRRKLPPTDFIIIDECHLSLAVSYQKVMCHYEDTPVLGLTATPWRTDGQ